MYIYSKLANGISFVDYVKSEKERSVNMPDRIVIVKGGAGVTDKVTMQIPEYVETEISKADYEFLKSNKTFIDFVDQGVMYASPKPLKYLDVSSVLTGSDGCAPLDTETLEFKAKSNGLKSGMDIVVNGK